MLASAAFLFYIISEVTVTNLQVEQETGIAGMFQKEGLRLFVEDCIQDSLEEAIVLVGQGGRIWYDTSQIEGTLSFSEDYNGILYAGNYYYLGITNDEGLEYADSYPCDEYVNETPAFCKYLYPENGDFGHKEGLTLTNIEKDIAKYLENNTITCVREFLDSNLSYSGDLGAGEVTLTVGIESDGIDVDIEYPLELTVEGETYFHLTEFDYFYQSELKTFLSKAVTTPLGKEQKDVDFNWTKEELDESSSYVSLSPVLTVTEVGPNTVGLGHRIITYELEADHILKNQPYTFSFAIANRPPALDFIEREACIEYDYIAIAGNNDFGSIDILVEAHDPDNDSIDFSYDTVLDNSPNNLNFLITETGIDYTYNLTADVPEDFPNPDVYNLTINASDTHLLSDWQDVRVLIDRPIAIEMAVENAYAQVYPEYNSTNTGGTLLSTEDPFYVSVSVPSQSVSSDVTQSATLSYTDAEHHGDFSANLQNSVADEYCFGFPWATETTGRNCVITDYTETELATWDELLITRENSHMNYSGITGTGISGTFELEFTTNYCSNFAPTEDELQEVTVYECLAVQNATHPFAYPYHETTVYSGTGSTYDPYNYSYESEEINPFYATHSCCNDDNTIKDTGSVCYKSVPGCYGQNVSEPSLILEEKVDICSGTRGNICGSLDSAISPPASTTLQYRLYKDELRCGSHTDLECNTGIAQECQDVLAWGIGDSPDGSNKGWCSGTMGCSSFCEDTPVYVGDLSNSDFLQELGSKTINELAQAGWTDEITAADFVCGCKEAEDAKPCISSDGIADVRFDTQCVMGQATNQDGDYRTEHHTTWACGDDLSGSP